jgi:DNA-binding transcriptional MerR regulator
MPEIVNIGVLAADTGEAARTLQHWSDLGILRPRATTDKRGRGYYREFVASPFHGERVWALVASALAKLRVPLGDIRRVMDFLRLQLDPNLFRRSDETNTRASQRRFKASPFFSALTAENPVLVLLRVDPSASAQQSTGVFVRFLPSITPDLIRPTAGEAGFLARSPSVEEIVRDQIAFLETHGGQGHLLNLTRILAPLRL